MFAKKKEISIKVKVVPEKAHYLLEEQIRASLIISATALLEIETINCYLAAFERSFDTRGAVPQENRKKFYEHGPIFAYKADRTQGTLKIPPNTDKNIAFVINPKISNISGSCLLANKLGVIWQIMVDVHLKKGYIISSSQEVHMHMGHQIYLQHAPQCSIVSFQKFFKHKPIEYRVLLHKTTFIASESVSMVLDIKNHTRMDLISMKTELVQTWTSHSTRFSESIKLMNFALNSPPLFPVPPSSERNKEIQFRLPERIAPSVVPKSKHETPVVITYEILLEFLTNRSDKHLISIPILIEDNFPAREAVPPPVITPPTKAMPNQPQPFPPTPDGSIQYINPQYNTLPVMHSPAAAASCYYNLQANASMASFQQPTTLYPQIPIAANYQTPNLPVEINNQANNNPRFSAPPLYPSDDNNNNNNFNNTFDLSQDGPQVVNVKEELLSQELNFVDINDHSNNNINNNINLNNNNDNNNNNQENNNNYFVNNGNNMPMMFPVIDGNNNVQYVPFFGDNYPQYSQVDYNFQEIPSDRPPAYNPNC